MAESYSPENLSWIGLTAARMRACSAGVSSLIVMPLAFSSVIALPATSRLAWRW